MKIIASKLQSGISLIEMMVAMAIALFLMAIALSIYMQETTVYNTTGTQASIQSAENALSALIAPTIRSAGFMGCTNLGNFYEVQNFLTPGTSPPLGTLTSHVSSYAPPPSVASGIFGYDALNSSGNPSPLAITENAANDGSRGDWNPNLDVNLTGSVEQGSDVLVVLGATPDSQPVSVIGVPTANSVVLPAGLAPNLVNQFQIGQWVSFTNCQYTSIFQITAPTANPVLNFNAGGGGPLTNQAGISLNNAAYGSVPIGLGGAFMQIVPLQQTAYFVGQGANGQSTLKRAILTGNSWAVSDLVPGVENMQVLYGVTNSAVSTHDVQQYVPASAVGDWTTVHSVRIGFLIAGQPGSGVKGTAPNYTATVLNTTVTIPSDTRLRHVFEMTVNVRNGS